MNLMDDLQWDFPECIDKSGEEFDLVTSVFQTLNITVSSVTYIVFNLSQQWFVVFSVQITYFSTEFISKYFIFYSIMNKTASLMLLLDCLFLVCRYTIAFVY